LTSSTEQEQQRVAVGPGNVQQFVSIRQVSLRCAAAAAAVDAAAIWPASDATWRGEMTCGFPGFPVLDKY